LQRTVQLIKRRRDLFFAGNGEAGEASVGPGSPMTTKILAGVDRIRDGEDTVGADDF
jgi:hypothetical protein